MVPIKEMTDVLKVVKEVIAVKPRQWVRLKRGIYKDDLAQVDFVNTARNQVLSNLSFNRKLKCLIIAISVSSSSELCKLGTIIVFGL